MGVVYTSSLREFIILQFANWSVFNCTAFILIKNLTELVWVKYPESEDSI